MASTREIRVEVIDRLSAVWPITPEAAKEYLTALAEMPPFALRKGMDSAMKEAGKFRPSPGELFKACAAFRPVESPMQRRRPNDQEADPVKQAAFQALKDAQHHAVYGQLETWSARLAFERFWRARAEIRAQLDEGRRNVGVNAVEAFGYTTWGESKTADIAVAKAEFYRNPDDTGVPSAMVDWANSLPELPPQEVEKIEARRGRKDRAA